MSAIAVLRRWLSQQCFRIITLGTNVISGPTTKQPVSFAIVPTQITIMQPTLLSQWLVTTEWGDRFAGSVHPVHYQLFANG